MTYSPLLAPTRPYNVLVNRPLASAYISATTHITAQVCPLASSRLFGALDAKDDDDLLHIKNPPHDIRVPTVCVPLDVPVVYVPVSLPPAVHLRPVNISASAPFAAGHHHQ